MKDKYRLLIKTIFFIEHFSVKEILLHGLCNSWKTLSLLYRPSTVHPLCHDAAYESCGASTHAPHVYQHLPVTRTNRARCCLSCMPCYKKGGFLPTEPTIGGGFLLPLRLAVLLSTLSFQVRLHSPTLQSCAELCVDHWSQFCRKAMSNFILICSLQLILMVVGGGRVAKLSSRQKCNCGRLCTTVWVFVGVEHELGTPVLHLSLVAPLRHCHH